MTRCAIDKILRYPTRRAELAAVNSSELVARKIKILNKRAMVVTFVSDEAGKISIGTYMAKRSDKLGGLEADNSAERPSFGMKVRSPSPQKPCQLVGSSSLSTVDESKCNSLMKLFGRARGFF